MLEGEYFLQGGGRGPEGATIQLKLARSEHIKSACFSRIESSYRQRGRPELGVNGWRVGGDSKLYYNQQRKLSTDEVLAGGGTTCRRILRCIN